MKAYKITQEQFELLQYFKRMFEFNADNIKQLCSGEKSDIFYGFELGQLYTSNRDWFMQFMDLENEVKNQLIVESEIYQYSVKGEDVTYTLEPKTVNND